jgi:ABC-type sugar transport system substrate-binding protein
METKPMKYLSTSTAAALATLALSACVENQQMTRSEPVAAAPAQTRPPANQAERNCVKAIARELGGTVSANDLWVISSEFSQAGTSVRVHVPSAEAPWACVVDRDGSVSRVYYTAEG